MWKAVLEDRRVGSGFALVGLCVLWPVMVLIALAIRFSSNRGVIEERPLEDGSGRSLIVFTCVGPLGAFLRRYSLQEMPTLFNLLMRQITLLELSLLYGEDENRRELSTVDDRRDEAASERPIWIPQDRGRQRFTAIIAREEDGYVALCPEFDIASQGETIEEAKRNLREAVELFLETASPEEVARRRVNELYVTHFDVEADSPARIR